MDTDQKTSRARIPAAPRATHAAARSLSLSTEPPPRVVDERSTDPYNTSGSFDRTKNWARVGKR
jgi:hypothetical protein